MDERSGVNISFCTYYDIRKLCVVPLCIANASVCLLPMLPLTISWHSWNAINSRQQTRKPLPYHATFLQQQRHKKARRASLLWKYKMAAPERRLPLAQQAVHPSTTAAT